MSLFLGPLTKYMHSYLSGIYLEKKKKHLMKMTVTPCEMCAHSAVEISSWMLPLFPGLASTVIQCARNDSLLPFHKTQKVSIFASDFFFNSVFVQRWQVNIFAVIIHKFHNRVSEQKWFLRFFFYPPLSPSYSLPFKNPLKALFVFPALYYSADKTEGRSPPFCAEIIRWKRRENVRITVDGEDFNINSFFPFSFFFAFLLCTPSLSPSASSPPPPPSPSPRWDRR